MAKVLTDAEIDDRYRAAVQAIADNEGNVSKASISLGIPRTTLRGWLAMGETSEARTAVNRALHKNKNIEYPDLPEDDVPTADIKINADEQGLAPNLLDRGDPIRQLLQSMNGVVAEAYRMA